MNSKTFVKCTDMLKNIDTLYKISVKGDRTGVFTSHELEFVDPVNIFILSIDVRSMQVYDGSKIGFTCYSMQPTMLGHHDNVEVVIHPDAIGDTVFLTREEAQDKLKSITEKTNITVSNLEEAIMHGFRSFDMRAEFCSKIKNNTGSISDGYHTFNELYDHRAALTAALFKSLPSGTVYKSKHHHDGTMYDGMFIVGTELPTGESISYHYDLDPWWGIFNIREVEHAPEWDGHTPDDVIERLKDYAKSNL